MSGPSLEVAEVRPGKPRPIEAHKFYKLALSYREQATQAYAYDAKQRLLAQAAFFDEFARDAALCETTPH
ncbi:MAG TPA: hypothetical protein VGF97_13025 [Rhizomicrobium sp.]|jgi:hypothetical protein